MTREEKSDDLQVDFGAPTATSQSFVPVNFGVPSPGQFTEATALTEENFRRKFWPAFASLFERQDLVESLSVVGGKLRERLPAHTGYSFVSSENGGFAGVRLTIPGNGPAPEQNVTCYANRVVVDRATEHSIDAAVVFAQMMVNTGQWKTVKIANAGPHLLAVAEAMANAGLKLDNATRMEIERVKGAPAPRRAAGTDASAAFIPGMGGAGRDTGEQLCGSMFAGRASGFSQPVPPA